MSEATGDTEAPKPRPGEAGPGLYGKISEKGDFVTRRLARGFVEPWDAWLQAAMAHSREKLGEDWLPVYLNAPIWRFVLSAGICGDAVMAGVLMPSIDKVGRHFPLALVAEADPAAVPTALFAAAAEWFAGLEDLALSTLEDDFAFEAFDEALAGCGPPPQAGAGTMEFGPQRPLEGRRWRFAADPASALGPGDPQILHQILRSFMAQQSLWWCAGSERVAPSFLVCDGLPQDDGFVALLDGVWDRWSWSGTKSGAMLWLEDEP